MSTKRKKTVEPNAASPGDLSTRAMLVKLRISRWGMKRTDSEVSQEIASMKQSKVSLGKFTKILLSSEALDAYRQAARECRRTHNAMTLPWDEGTGLLPSALYFKYTEAISKQRDEALQHVTAFVREYEEQWAAGLKDYRKDLGSLFDEGDYPEPKYVASKFGIQIRTFPISDPNDFRVSLGAGTQKAVKEQMYQDFQADLQDAMRKPFTRLYDVVRKVHDRLSDSDAIFRDSLIENVRELIEVLPALNVLNDPELDALIRQTDKAIGAVSDIKALRKDPKYRKQVAKSANDILIKMKGYTS